MTASEIYGWDIIAWAVLDNHYHILVKHPGRQVANTSSYVSSFHKFTARRWNDQDGTPGRRVWWNYWDRCVRNEKDLLVRLKYILWNPVKHGLVDAPEEYPFSSYEECMRAWDTGLGILNFSEASDVPES